MRHHRQPGAAFCAGQDLNDPDMVAGTGGAGIDVGAVIERHYRPLATRVRSMPVPVVAAVNGVAAGAGANLALVLRHRRWPRRSASFIQAFSKIGLVPDCGGTWLLPRLVGRARALGLAMTGDKLSAEEAQRIGLIWQCVDDAVFEESVRWRLAQRLAAMPSKALVQTRRVHRRRGAHGLSPTPSRLEADTQRELGRCRTISPKGVAAFFAKRPAGVQGPLNGHATPQQVAEAARDAMWRDDRASRRHWACRCWLSGLAPRRCAWPCAKTCSMVTTSAMAA